MSDAPRHYRARIYGRYVEAAGAEVRRLVVAPSAYAASEGAHAVAVVTEWDEFRTLDFARIHGAMMKPAFLFDGRNILPADRLRELGFRVYAIGR